MTYRIVYTARVNAEIAAQLAFMRDTEVSEGVIEGWFAALFDRIDSLREWPRRHPVAEDASLAEGEEIRRLVFGSYIVLYQIDEPSRIIHVLAFYHGYRASDGLPPPMYSDE